MLPSDSTALYPSTGEILDGKFEVKKLLGEGGMGAVAKGWDMELHRDVALKFMSPHMLMIPGAVERFLMEAQAAARVRNDHVVEFYARGLLKNGTPFLVMEFLDGRDLSQILESEGASSITLPRAIHFTLQILRGLQVAHSLGVIHRDMKPSNCFVVHREGEADFVKVVDFGISKITDAGDKKSAANLTKTNSALGTPLYMSPEQAKSPRDVDHRSDLYSVAAILYELLSGRTPHLSESGEFAEILVKLLTAAPTPLTELRPDLPSELIAAVHKGLASDRDERFATALEFAEAISIWADDRSAWVLRRMRSDRRAGSDAPPPRPLAPGSIAPPPNAGAPTVKGFVPGAPPRVPGLPSEGLPSESRSPIGRSPVDTASAKSGPASTGTSGPRMDRSGMMAATVASSPPPPIVENRSETTTAASSSTQALREEAAPTGGAARRSLLVAVPILVLAAGGIFAFFTATRKSSSSPVTADPTRVSNAVTPIAPPRASLMPAIVDAPSLSASVFPPAPSQAPSRSALVKIAPIRTAPTRETAASATNGTVNAFRSQE